MFNVGDRIRHIRSNHTGTIEEEHTDAYTVRWDHDEHRTYTHPKRYSWYNWTNISKESVVPETFPRNITFTDIRVGDRVEATHIESGDVVVTTVTSVSPDRQIKYTRAGKNLLGTSYDLGVGWSYRLLSRPKPEIKVGDMITRDRYLELPRGSVISDPRLDDIAIFGSASGNRIKSFETGRTWARLEDNGMQGLVKFINK